MKATETLGEVGFVPSLEVLPFLAWATPKGVKTKAHPGYGNVHRGLLTGELDGGLVPWELALTDLILLPGQQSAWRIPLVLKACPVELVLSRAALKKVYPRRARRSGDESVHLTFGIEAHNSLTLQQILAWQKRLAVKHLEPPAFKALPMNLMLRGLAKGELDGFLAPAPWGMQAESEGLGKIDTAFTSGEFARHLVMVCNERMMESKGAQISSAAGELRPLRDLIASPEALNLIFREMGEMGHPRLDIDVACKAARRYHLDALPDEFIPDEGWFERELGLLLTRHGIKSTRSVLTSLGRRLKARSGSAAGF
jgi:hypothetical protein